MTGRDVDGEGVTGRDVDGEGVMGRREIDAGEEHADAEAPPTTHDVDEIAIVGAGLMGHGIAIAYALSGHPVRLYDVDGGALVAAGDRIDSVLETFREHGSVDRQAVAAAHERITVGESFETAVASADLVTEAVVEDLDVKRRVFVDLDTHAPDDAILATNTSGFSITELADEVDDPGRVVGTHWFTPPYVVPLVEVVRGEETTDATVDRTYALLAAVGKTPVVVERDVPGFIGNRIQLAMAYEAFSLLEAEVASAADIDRAVKAGFGFRLPVLGIFEKADHSGLAVHNAIESYLLPELDRGTDPSSIVERLVEEGHDGLSSGREVYDWSELDSADVYEQRDRALLDLLSVYESLEE